MPEMDGVETLHEIRKHTDGPNISTPVICLTADAVVGARNRYLSKGFTDYLTKPIDSVDLENMLKKYIPDEKIEAAGKKDPSGSQPFSGSLKYDKLQDAGVDTSAGIKNCTDEALYEKILVEYLKSSDEKISKMDAALTNEDLKNYGIIVHSVKSTSATIGAMEVSQIAQKLEKAANDSDIEYVKREHGSLIKAYSSLLDSIRESVSHSADMESDTNGDVMEFDPDDNEIMEFDPE